MFFQNLNEHNSVYILCSLLLRILYIREYDDIRLHFGSKTPYTKIENNNTDNFEYKVLGPPKKIWMIIRHGKRFPNDHHSHKMTMSLPAIKEYILDKNTKATEFLTRHDIESIRNWTITVTEEDINKLTIEGQLEMQQLSKRMQLRFPEVFTTKYLKNLYQFNYTNTNRTFESARHFAVGLFGEQMLDNNVFSESSTTDPILRFYKLCKKWQSDVKRNPVAYYERKKFEESVLAKNAVVSMNNKLGLQETLSFDDIDLLYKTCAIETVGNKISPWCIPFDIDTIKLMEFAEDLKHYWLDGYGYELTAKQACPAFKSMMEFFENESQYPKVVLNFTHSGALLKLLAHLQLYKDDKPLRHTDFETSKDRKWKLSKIGAFSSNIMFVLYQCYGTNKILVLHQERIIRLPCCPDSDFCDVDVIKKFYNDSINNCKFDKICENG